MRIGVVGAGAVGGAIAALLARGGHDVEVTARGEHLAALQAEGLILQGVWGDFTAEVAANDVLTRGPELAIVATKAHDAVAAIRQNVAMLRGIPVVLIQNGLDGLDAARKAAPRSDFIGGLAMFATSYLSPGVITVTTGGPIYLGGDADEGDVPALYAESVLATVMGTKVVPNFRGAQWTKLVVNMLNALARDHRPLRAGGDRGPPAASHHDREPAGDRADRDGKRRALRVAAGPHQRAAAAVLASSALARPGRPAAHAHPAREGAEPRVDTAEHPARAADRDRPPQRCGRAGCPGDRSRGAGQRGLLEMVHEVEASGQFLPIDEVVSRSR